MRAISVRQPWAWAILHGKDVENRSRPWPLGEYALHASKLPHSKREVVPDWFVDDWESCEDMAAEAGLDWRRSVIGPLTYRHMLAMSGAIIGTMRVTACVTEHPSPFFCGPFGLVLANVRPIVPIPCKGSLGAWVVPEDIEAAVRRAAGASHD
jgi:hypothetical protein